MMRSGVGSLGWTRTNDQRINSPTLYQLSYQGTESLARARILAVRLSDVKQSLPFSDLRPEILDGGDAVMATSQAEREPDAPGADTVPSPARRRISVSSSKSTG